MLSHLLGCTTVFLQGLPEGRGLPQRVLVGVEGVANPYACGGPGCDGLLYVESLGEVSKTGEETTVFGRDCEATYENTYRVTVSRCAPVYDAGSTTGEPVNIELRNALATDVLNDMWGLMAALHCCLLEDGALCGGQVTGSGHSLESGCAKYWVDVSWEHLLCC